MGCAVNRVGRNVSGDCWGGDWSSHLLYREAVV